jgi:hypothetical protein
VDGTLPDGFVVSVVPADGETGVPLDRSITVTYNQPMVPSSVVNPSSYSLTNLTIGRGVSLRRGSYNPSTYTVTIPIRTTDKDWDPNSEYEFIIGRRVANFCGTLQGVEIISHFNTGATTSTETVYPTPEAPPETESITNPFAALFDFFNELARKIFLLGGILLGV